MDDKNKKGHFFERRSAAVLAVILGALSLIFLYVEHLTHIEFFFHLAAIPLEVLLAVFIVEKLLEKRESKLRRRQLMFIKSHMFRAEMRTLFIKNFAAVKSPPVSLQSIREASLEELKKMRIEAEFAEYKSLEAMEPVIEEYVRAQPVWQQFIDRATQFNFEDILESMIFILHFVSDVKLFKESNPGKLFIHEAAKNDILMGKVRKVLGDGIRKFLDYAIELKEKHPDMFHEILNDYEVCSQICMS